MTNYYVLVLSSWGVTYDGLIGWIIQESGAQHLKRNNSRVTNLTDLPRIEESTQDMGLSILKPGKPQENRDKLVTLNSTEQYRHSILPLGAHILEKRDTL